MTYTRPNELKFQMKLSDVIDATIGRSDGRTTLRKRCHAPAPSTAAASTSSSGICWRPARSATVVCGMPTHTPTTITAGRAVLKSPSQLMLLGNPITPRAALSGPPLGV